MKVQRVFFLIILPVNLRILSAAQNVVNADIIKVGKDDQCFGRRYSLTVSYLEIRACSMPVCICNAICVRFRSFLRYLSLFFKLHHQMTFCHIKVLTNMTICHIMRLTENANYIHDSRAIGVNEYLTDKGE